MYIHIEKEEWERGTHIMRSATNTCSESEPHTRDIRTCIHICKKIHIAHIRTHAQLNKSVH